MRAVFTVLHHVWCV